MRGGAPASRETDLCRPGTLVERVHAILLSGGSAFGLSAASGAVRYLWERGIGFPTPVTPVPIVPAACIFDLGLGEIDWPDETMGYEACAASSPDPPQEGCVGAGTGAAVGMLFGLDNATKSGVGTASTQIGATIVGALVVVNAFGDVVLPNTGEIIAGARRPGGAGYANTVAEMLSGQAHADDAALNTTIAVIATNAPLTSAEANRVALAAHDALSIVIRPVHTILDGDTIFTLATGTLDVGKAPPPAVLQVAVVHTLQRAILRAVARATPLGGLPAAILPPDFKV